jgi:selenocysteine-specific elongation factor
MIVGTAGHVDHGKTALIQALTGTNTDSLAEEQARGITIDLGFAHAELPSGRRLSFVDVPGHERFIKTMVAGVGGLDLVLLVIAANEGIMPQTREHLEVCRFLGVRRGLVVLSKADLLDGLGTEWRSRLEAEVRKLVSGTQLADAPLLTVSSKTAQGLEELRAELDRQAALPGLDEELAARRAGLLFVPVDRAFILKGFGLVVTGTVMRGRVAIHDEVVLCPGPAGRLRVRGLQVQGRAVAEAKAGQRVALNLPDASVRDVARGAVIVDVEAGPSTNLFDVELEWTKAAPSRNLHAQHFFLTAGTAQSLVRLRRLRAAAPGPESPCVAQLASELPLALTPNQRFVLRAQSDGRVVAGGRILLIQAPRRRARGAPFLERLARARADERLEILVAEAGRRGARVEALRVELGVSARSFEAQLDADARRGRLARLGGDSPRVFDTQVLSTTVTLLQQELEAFHQRRPEAVGLAPADLSATQGGTDVELLRWALDELVRTGAAVLRGGFLALPTHALVVKPHDEPLTAEVAALLTLRGLSPPHAKDLADRFGVPLRSVEQVLRTLVGQGRVVRAGPFHFDVAAVKRLEERLVKFLDERGRISTAELKDLVGQSRKFTIPLAEYFDRERVTLRVGDVRTARRGGNVAIGKPRVTD